MRRILTGLLLTVTAVLGACSGGSGSASDVEGDEWFAAELTAVPDGYRTETVDESSSFGRMIGYRAPVVPGTASSSIFVTASVPMNGTVAEMIDEEVPATSSEPDAPSEGQVSGHRAFIRPVTPGDGASGWRVIWEPTPEVQLEVADLRREGVDGGSSTAESALALAESVGTIDRERWSELMAGGERMGGSPTTLPGAGEREIADGAVDGRQWTLSVMGDWAGPAPDSCFRLAYAGEDTGEGCAVERVVLAGKQFVLVATADSTRTDDLRPGRGSDFDPVEPRSIAYGPDEGWHVAFAVLPDGACGVETFWEGMAPVTLDLLPGDPGVEECVGA